MITTFSGAAVRSEISEAGKFSLDQYQRPSLAWRTWLSSARNASRSSAGAGTELLARLERQLERRGAQVREQDVQVVRVEARLLGRALEQELRVVDDVLVDRRAGGDEDRDARALPPSGPPELLPGGRDRPRVAGQDRDVEAADVDAELERVGGDDAEDLAVAQAVLDRPPLGRQVAAAIAADARARPVTLAQRFAQAGQQDLDRDARPPEDDRLAPGAQERQRPALGERRGRAAGAALRMEDRRVDQDDVALAGRCAVPVDEAGRPGGQHRRELGRVPDGRRAADDHRMAAVVGADAQQPAEDVRDVAAEDAAVGVQLVDDDEPQLLEQLEPLGVVGQDRRVEHVRVGDDDLAGGSHGRTDRRRRVAVVGRGRDVQAARGRQLAEFGHLVLAERLGREEKERASGRVLGDGLEDRHGVAQRLAGRGRGHDHDVRTGMDDLDRFGLVGVRPGDAATRESGHDPRVEPVGELGEVGRSRGQDGVVDDASCDRWLIEQAGQDGTGLGGGVGSHVGCLWKRTDVRNARV